MQLENMLTIDNRKVINDDINRNEDITARKEGLFYL